MTAAALPPPGAGDVVYLVDISGWIHRVWHKAPVELSATGEPCQLVRGCTQKLVRLLRERDPALLAVAYEGTGPGWRREAYPAYKADRVPLPEDARRQVRELGKIVRAHRIPVLAAPGFEADDAIAAAVRHAEAAGLRVVIVARDKDLEQLCSPQTVLWDGEASVIGPDEVRATWGVGPELLGDLLALAGDTTDKVPGVPGFGPKIAAEFLGAARSLEGLLAQPWLARTARQRTLLARHLLVNVDGRPVAYEAKHLEQVVLAYATTIHKAQGAEFPAVVIPILNAHYVMLVRNLLYTAVTRAKRVCVLVGDPKAIATAVRQTKRDVRRTRLAVRLGGT